MSTSKFTLDLDAHQVNLWLLQINGVLLKDFTISVRLSESGNSAAPTVCDCRDMTNLTRFQLDWRVSTTHAGLRLSIPAVSVIVANSIFGGESRDRLCP